MENQRGCQGHNIGVDHVSDIDSVKGRVLAAQVILHIPVAYDYGGVGFDTWFFCLKS